jgi:hypothetical protein
MATCQKASVYCSVRIPLNSYTGRLRYGGSVAANVLDNDRFTGGGESMLRGIDNGCQCLQLFVVQLSPGPLSISVKQRECRVPLLIGTCSAVRMLPIDLALTLALGDMRRIVWGNVKH